MPTPCTPVSLTPVWCLLCMRWRRPERLTFNLAALPVSGREVTPSLKPLILKPEFYLWFHMMSKVLCAAVKYQTFYRKQTTYYWNLAPVADLSYVTSREHLWLPTPTAQVTHEARQSLRTTVQCSYTVQHSCYGQVVPEASTWAASWLSGWASTFGQPHFSPPYN